MLTIVMEDNGYYGPRFMRCINKPDLYNRFGINALSNGSRYNKYHDRDNDDEEEEDDDDNDEEEEENVIAHDDNDDNHFQYNYPYEPDVLAMTALGREVLSKNEKEEECETCIASENEIQRLRMIIDDIKGVLTRPVLCQSDYTLYLNLIQNIVNPGEKFSNNNLKRQLEGKEEEEGALPPNKKIRHIVDADIDLEYKFRIDNTDVFHCTLCDPLKYITHRGSSGWRDHCTMDNLHRNKKANHLIEKK